MKQIALLGATGSIGDSAIDVITRHPERYQLSVLTAHTQWQKCAHLCARLQVPFAVLSDAHDAADFLNVAPNTQLYFGPQGLIDCLQHADTVITGIVGAAGLAPTLAAARAGKTLLLANKEPLVCAGELVVQEAKASGAKILPLDSEHNAIFQCLHHGVLGAGVEKILLTASGGPFLHLPLDDLKHVTPAQACKHPNWVMGQKISVDSASMMNKGLEVIEARWLFDCPAEQIEVLIHPQSVVHSMVQYLDGSVLAQMGQPDMRTPIAHALAYPERISSGVSALDFSQLTALTFMPPDLTRFPCLRLAYAALQQGGLAPCVLNAANEVAVARFLNHELAFTDIPRVLEKALSAIATPCHYDEETIFEFDALTRTYTKNLAV
ncbi:MAG: hypothetical protein RLZZ502_1505 [Pseudomonadota bacterium]